MASAVSHDNLVISNTQDKSSYMEKKCKTYPYTPCKIPSNRFKDKHIGTPKTYSTACAILYKEMLKNLSNAPLVVPVYLQRPGSCIQNHHTVTVRPWVLMPLPMPSETAVVHPAQSMFSKGPQKLQSFCKTQNKSAQLQ